MDQRTWTVLGLTVLALFFLSLATPLTVYSALSPAEKAYRIAEQCMSQVKQTPASKQTPAQWKQCLTRFKSMAQKYAASSIADDATFQIAEIYQTLYQKSKDEKDRLEAVRWYERVIQQYPKSLLKKNADRAIARMTPLPEPASSPSEKAMLSPEEGTGTPVASNPGLVKGIRHWTGNQYTRVVVDLSSQAAFNPQIQESPPRLLIDVRPSRMLNEMTPIPIHDGTVQEVHAGQLDQDTVRVILSMEKMERYKVFTLINPDRLVIDIMGNSSSDNSDPAPENNPDVPPAVASIPPMPAPVPQPLEETLHTIVIDPGHGGEDPGAIGKGGLQEKDIVLDVGLRLKTLLESRFGKKVILTRDRDVFIPLEERTAIANSRGADLFLSIHVNASPREGARGIETYLLGRSASREATLTAARENSTSEKSVGDLENILTDLMTTVKKEESLRFAHYVQGSLVSTLQPRYPILDLGVKQAPFYVLVNANMPSILAEISFVSNRDEEKRLANSEYRQQIAEALLSGVEKFISTMKYAYQQSE